jgi:hypothetical protein
MDNFETHPRGTARELSLLRAMAVIMATQQKRMLSLNCYPKELRDKYNELVAYYEEEDRARAV